MTREEERLAAFIRQVRKIITAVWPEGGTMYVSPCEKKEAARPAQEPGWSLQLSIKMPAEQPAPQPGRSSSEQFQQDQLF